jgi:hypothetical protein
MLPVLVASGFHIIAVAFDYWDLVRKIDDNIKASKEALQKIKDTAENGNGTTNGNAEKTTNGSAENGATNGDAKAVEEKPADEKVVVVGAAKP